MPGKDLLLDQTRPDLGSCNKKAEKVNLIKKELGYGNLGEKEVEEVNQDKKEVEEVNRRINRRSVVGLLYLV